MSDLLVAEAYLPIYLYTYTTHKKHKRRTSVPSKRIEFTIPEIERLQTCALDRQTTEIGGPKYRSV
jgi:hypothetical protein